MASVVSTGIRREVVEDVVRVRRVLLLVEVAGHEALHGGRQGWPMLGAVEDLQIDSGKMVIVVPVKLALILCQRLTLKRRAHQWELVSSLQLGTDKSAEHGVWKEIQPEGVLERMGSFRAPCFQHAIADAEQSGFGNIVPADPIAELLPLQIASRVAASPREHSTYMA